uniref:Aquaporin n=1 Tax=Panagrolaimus superbus TaxID=310955 RepID=A0A914YDB9_9BILA
MSFGRFLLYFFAQTLGAFIAAAMIFGIYYDAINNFDQGTRELFGKNGTGIVFTSFPQPFLSITNGIFDQIAGTALLCLSVKAIIDKNTAIPYYLHPLLIGLAVFVIATGFAYNGMGSINPARDFGPRLFLWVAGYSWEAIR